MKITFRKTGINGEGIGYINRKPVFVQGVLPEETADITVTETNARYSRGKVNRIINESRDRVKPVCRHQKYCGGCSMMIMSYRKQLETKRELLKETLEKYADYHGEIEPCTASEKITGYRNKANLPFVYEKGKLANALYFRDSNHPVIIDDCPIHDKKLESIRKKILDVLNEYHCQGYDRKTKKGFRQLVMRILDDHCQIAFVTGNDSIRKEIIDKISSIKEVESIYQGINTISNPVNMLPDDLKLLYGKPRIEFNYGKLSVEIAMKAFFQLNRQQGFNIYQTVEDMIPENCGNVVEAYCGIGLMSLAVAEKANKVTGIEIVPEAIADARRNAKRNNIENVEFICGDSCQEIIRVSKKQPIDVLIADPPRTGLDDQLVENLLAHPVKTIIYVSCNPATLARNIQTLKKQYLVEKVIPFDMFPNTPNIESVTLLRLSDQTSVSQTRKRK